MSYKGEVTWLAEIQAYVAGIGLTTLYYTSGRGLTTKPTDTPANTHYARRILDAGSINRTLFAGTATQGATRIGFGDIILSNADNALQPLLAYGFSGRTITIKRTDVINPSYADFTSAWVGTMDQPEMDGDNLRIKLRDARYALAVPLQPTKYTGAGLGTLEGAANLQGQPKPVVYGSPLNVTPVCVETAKLIYQVSDVALHSIDNVYDRGLPLPGYRSFTAQATIGPFLGGDNVTAVIYGAGQYVVAGSGGKMATSPDGSVWTTRTSGFAGTGINGITYSPTLALYVAAGDSGKLFTSSDAITWTARTSQFGTDSIQAVRWLNGLFLAVGGTGARSTLSTSADGVTWTLRTTSGGNVLFDIAYGNGLYVGVGYNSYASPDGITWTVSSGSTVLGSPAYSVAFGGGIFAAGSDNGAIAISVDGINWAPRLAGFGAGHRVLAMTYLQSGFVAVGDNGSVGTSFDGGVWTTMTTSGFSGAVLIDVAPSATGTPFIGGAGGTVGLPSATVTYASSADLLDDTKAPDPGTYKVFLDSTGSYFRLGATPAGLITCDPVEGATAADRTTAQVFKRILARPGYTPNAGDITALDAAAAGVIGFYQGTTDVNIGDVCDQVAGSVGAAWYIDQAGAFRIAQFTGPAATSVIAWTKRSIVGRPARQPNARDPNNGLPIWRETVQYAKNWTVQASDLAGAVTTDRRTFLALEYRSAKDEDASVQTMYPLAPAPVEPSLLVFVADAAAEATRRLTLRKRRRDTLVLAGIDYVDTNAVVDLAQTIQFTHDDVGGTHRYVVLGIQTDAAGKQIQATVWGPE